MKFMKSATIAATLASACAGALLGSETAPSAPTISPYTVVTFLNFLMYQEEHQEQLAQLSYDTPLTVSSGSDSLKIDLGMLTMEHSVTVIKGLNNNGELVWGIVNTQTQRLASAIEHESKVREIFQAACDDTAGEVRGNADAYTVFDEVPVAFVQEPPMMTASFTATTTTTISAAELEKFAPELYALAASQAQAEAAQASARVPATN